MNVSSAGIMAAGTGSRLGLSPGHSKALVIVRERPLIDHIVSDCLTVGIEFIAVVVRPDDKEVRAHLAATFRNDATFEFIPAEPNGTLTAVLKISEVLGTEDHVLSTCDVITESGTLGRLLKAVPLERPLMVLLTSRLIDDDDPIWVHVDPGGIVERLGKGIPPSDTTFGNVRWVSSRLQPALRSLPLHTISRDSDMMRLLVETFPGQVRAFDGGSVFDVDRPDDVDRANRAK
jgi:NDP-sugar pyrophosphorylase family protein